jgi:hypothetical protein
MPRLLGTCQVPSGGAQLVVHILFNLNMTYRKIGKRGCARDGNEKAPVQIQIQSFQEPTHKVMMHVGNL